MFAVSGVSCQPVDYVFSSSLQRVLWRFGHACNFLIFFKRFTMYSDTFIY